MRLHHLHIRNPIPYIHSLRLQEALLEKQFTYKTALRNSNNNTNASLNPQTTPPQPTLLTFQTHPTYTVGRRHLNTNPLSPAQISFLTGGTSNSPSSNGATDTTTDLGDLATFFPSPRGGLLTYHAPGQLTAYLILDLRAHSLTPRCYIRLLENTVMRTCARHGVPNVTTTEDPGVWVAEKSDKKSSTSLHTNITQTAAETCIAGSSGTTDSDTILTPTTRKICAIGVHVSRGVTSHGIGLNVYDAPIETFSRRKEMYTLPKGNIYTGGGDESLAPGWLSWGFSRVVACGLEGKSVTWLDREQGVSGREGHVRIDEVAGSLACEVARSLKLDEGEIERIDEGDVLGG